MNLQVPSGYKATAYNTEQGLTMVVDTVFRFMSTITVLDQIKQLRRDASGEKRFKELVLSTIIGSSIIADWGNKRTYIVADIDFKTNPVK